MPATAISPSDVKETKIEEKPSSRPEALSASPLFAVKRDFRGGVEGDQVTAEQVVKAGCDIEFLVGNGTLQPLTVGGVTMMGYTPDKDSVSRVSHEQALTALRMEIEEKHSRETKDLRADHTRISGERANMEETIKRVSQERDTAVQERDQARKELESIRGELNAERAAPHKPLMGAPPPAPAPVHATTPDNLEPTPGTAHQDVATGVQPPPHPETETPPDNLELPPDVPPKPRGRR